MSKFFRSPNSSGSSSGSDSDDEETEEVMSASLSQLDISTRQEYSGSSLGSIPIDRTATTVARNEGQDWLLHSLLEERCLNQVIMERTNSGDPKRHANDREVKQEARRRYRILCAQLAPLNLVSVGTEEDRHGATRQRIRDGLDRALHSGMATPTRQSSFPAPLRGLLTDGRTEPVLQGWQAGLPMESGSPASVFDFLSTFHQPLPSRYLKDFDELGLLGKGGYGQVFHVRHRLDGRTYAVKKVPIRPSMVQRITIGGQAVLDEILIEVRSLSRLDHPNVVRYFSSWIEWSSGSSFTPPTCRDGPTSPASEVLNSSDKNYAIGGAEIATSGATESIHRVKTQSNSDEDAGFIFESRSQHTESSLIAVPEDSDILSRSISDVGLISSSRPSLAIHMQMDIYPMTLADFLSPPQSSPVKPLAHCFHISPSLRILLALLDGVEYLHTEGIVHRDLKPANIFLRLESNSKAVSSCVDLSHCSACQLENCANPVTLSVRIGDFGLVTSIAQSGDLFSAPPPTHAAGTELYRPAASKSSVSPKLDIFALGIIACELLTQFSTQMERRETLHALRKGQFPDGFAGCAGHQSSKVKECVAAMLSDEPSEDTTIGELRHELEALLSPPLTASDTLLRRSST
ncbi:PEK protein kinase [Zymoseptoria brevis]|uniref:PEK protein kinase n=1 Tax=Zymoseptoria brevis TaxID=1047168 RepID=A0A0F4GKA1_9PEZI|nr:PEK protein kinase [Zymoseptoria brevis]